MKREKKSWSVDFAIGEERGDEESRAKWLGKRNSLHAFSLGLTEAFGPGTENFIEPERRRMTDPTPLTTTASAADMDGLNKKSLGSCLPTWFT